METAAGAAESARRIRLRDADAALAGHFTDLPALIAPGLESLANAGGLRDRHREEEAARGFGFEEQADERGRQVSGDREARGHRGLEMAPVALHAAAPVSLFGERQRAVEPRKTRRTDRDSGARGFDQRCDVAEQAASR